MMHVPDTYPRPAGTPLPPSSHAKPIDTFGPAKELELELRRVLRGEVRFDAGARAIYASDGSNYRQAPIGVVIPADNDDVIAAMAACRKFGAPVLVAWRGNQPRGPVLQRCRRVRLHEVHEPDSRDESGAAATRGFSRVSSATRFAMRRKFISSHGDRILRRTTGALWAV